MKPHPRIRKTVKWGGAAVTVLLGVVWIGSGWFSFAWVSKEGTGLSLFTGRLSLAAGIYGQRPMDSPYFATSIDSFYLQWWFEGERKQSGWEFAIPLWVPVIVIVAVTAAAWRLDTLATRRAHLNLCRKCHYDRTGLAPQAVCPECGAAAIVPPPAVS